MQNAISQPADADQPWSAPSYTARNRDREPAAPRAGATTTQAAHLVQADQNRQRRIQAAIALRMSYRIEQDVKGAFARTAYEHGLQRCLWLLYSIREAESVEAMIDRDRRLAGMIDGAHAFGALPNQAVDKLMTLRESAFQYRRKELLP